MEVKLVSVKNNPLLNRKEVDFLVETKMQAKTPTRTDIKKSIADQMKISEEIVFIKKMQTLTGSNMTIGIANIYDSITQANLIEAERIELEEDKLTVIEYAKLVDEIEILTTENNKLKNKNSKLQYQIEELKTKLKYDDAYTEFLKKLESS